MMFAKFAPSINFTISFIYFPGDVPEEAVVMDILCKGLKEYKKSAFFAYSNLPMTDSSITAEICVCVLNFKNFQVENVLSALSSLNGNDANMVVSKLLQVTFGVE
jgi:hypothetical protein